MVRAHRQAWAWQDEWHGLSIDDIRDLEAETQRALARKMIHTNGDGQLREVGTGSFSFSPRCHMRTRLIFWLNIGAIVVNFINKNLSSARNQANGMAKKFYDRIFALLCA